MANRAWTLACERTVNRLEKVLDRLGWTSEALAGKDTTCAACGHTWRASAPEGTERVECSKCGEYVTHGRQPEPTSATLSLVQIQHPNGTWKLLDTGTGHIIGTGTEQFAGVPVRTA